MKKKKNIRYKVNGLLLIIVFVAMVLAGGTSIYSLYFMKHISTENNRELGQTAANDTEKALEELAVEHLQDIVAEKAVYIEEKFATIEAYVLGIAAQAQNIYEYPEKYPDREVELPVADSKELAAQLLWSEKLLEVFDDEEVRKNTLPFFTEEILKLGNIQDLLIQYNANNEMVSSAYIATESGWMIQADYIAYSKYENSNFPVPYEATERQWYQYGKKAKEGQIVYTDVMKDIHHGGDCIVCASPVYYNGKVVAVAGVGSYLETVNNVVWNTTIGEEGYAFLVNENGQVIISGRTEGETAAYGEQEIDLRKSNNLLLAEAASGMVDGQMGCLKLTLDGREVYLAYAPLKSLGWSFVIVIDVAEIVAPAKESQEIILTMAAGVAKKQDAAIKQMLLIFAVVMVGLTLFISMCGTWFSGKITKPIQRLTGEVTKINGGNLDYRIHINTGDEVEDLGNAFNNMTAQIQNYIKNLANVTAEKERIRTEIQVASRLQADMLPDTEGAFEDRKEFAISAFMKPAKGVGGDFYDFFLLDENHLALVMADVSGKGVPAALFMVVSRTLIRSHLMAGVNETEGFLEKAVSEINNSLCTNNKNGMFVTAWIGVLTLSTGELIFINAGHCPPFIIHSDGTFAYETASGGFVLGGMEGMPYRQSKVRLQKEDTLFLYTDGVTEATSIRKELYGESRLKTVAEKTGGISTENLIDAVWQDVDSFQKETEQFDDITMLAISYHGNDFVKKTGKPAKENIMEFAIFIEENLKKHGICMEDILKMQMTADEILSNICYYSKANEVTLGIGVEKRQEVKNITLCFEDDGIPYNPLKKSDPDVAEPLEKRKTGGLGIYLVKKRMDSVAYRYEKDRNYLTVMKKVNTRRR